MLFLKNAISKRQLSIKRAFPDALDLLLICIESGMSIEIAFRKVSIEIVTQSVALSEEFTLTTAELSYLQDRKVAYENLAKRTGLEGVKSVCLALQQSERYGTPLGQSLRVMAQENRDMRMNEAEKKAAALAAEADGADDPVLPAGAVRRHSRTDRHQGRGSIRPADNRLASMQVLRLFGREFGRSVGTAERRHRRRPGAGARIVLAAQHLLQIGDIGRRLVRRQIGLHDASASAKRPCRPTTRPRFCRTRASAPVLA